MDEQQQLRMRFRRCRRTRREENVCSAPVIDISYLLKQSHQSRPLATAHSPRLVGEPPLLSDNFKYSPWPVPASSSLSFLPISPSFFSAMDAAIATLTSLGFSEDDIRDTIYEILQAYDNDAVIGWRFIRECNYKIVVNMLEYKRMKEKQAKSKHEKMYAPYNAEEFNYTPTKCYGMINSDEEDED